MYSHDVTFWKFTSKHHKKIWFLQCVRTDTSLSDFYENADTQNHKYMVPLQYVFTYSPLKLIYLKLHIHNHQEYSFAPVFFLYGTHELPNFNFITMYIHKIPHQYICIYLTKCENRENPNPQQHKNVCCKVCVHI